jgi:hypothetical protein
MIVDGPSKELVENKVAIGVEKRGVRIGDNVQNSQRGLEK